MAVTKKKSDLLNVSRSKKSPGGGTIGGLFLLADQASLLSKIR